MLITDVVMPRMGGRELAKALARTHPETRVIYMSGYVDDDTWREDVSGFAFVQKPFSPLELVRRVREVLDRSPEPDPASANSTRS